MEVKKRNLALAALMSSQMIGAVPALASEEASAIGTPTEPSKEASQSIPTVIKDTYMSAQATSFVDNLRTVGGDRTMLYWDTVSGASYYKVILPTGYHDENYDPISEINSTTPETSLPMTDDRGVEQEFTIQAYDEFDVMIDQGTKTIKPSSVRASLRDQEVDLSWAPPAGTSSTLLVVDGQGIDNYSAYSYNYEGGTEKNVNAVVKFLDSNKNVISEESFVFWTGIKKIDSDSIITETLSEDSVKVSWESNPLVGQYEIWGTGDDQYVTYYTGSSNEAVISGLIPGKNYTLRLIAQAPLNTNDTSSIFINVSTPAEKIDITTAQDLLDIPDGATGDYVLKNDIDLTGVEWKPISRFAGTFDGGGHTISNATLQYKDGDGKVGQGVLFFELVSPNNGVHIHDLNVTNASFKTTSEQADFLSLFASQDSNGYLEGSIRPVFENITLQASADIDDTQTQYYKDWDAHVLGGYGSSAFLSYGSGATLKNISVNASIKTTGYIGPFGGFAYGDGINISDSNIKLDVVAPKVFSFDGVANSQDGHFENIDADISVTGAEFSQVAGFASGMYTTTTGENKLKVNFRMTDDMVPADDVYRKGSYPIKLWASYVGGVGSRDLDQVIDKLDADIHFDFDKGVEIDNERIGIIGGVYNRSENGITRSHFKFTSKGMEDSNGDKIKIGYFWPGGGWDMGVNYLIDSYVEADSASNEFDVTATGSGPASIGVTNTYVVNGDRSIIVKDETEDTVPASELTKKSSFASRGFDFDNTWSIPHYDGIDIPRLRWMIDPAPSITTKVEQNNKLKVSWTASPGATKYLLFEDGKQVLDTPSTLSFEKELEDTDEHKYEVLAITSKGATLISEATAKASSIPVVQPPKTDPPVVEPPKTDPPVVEPPKADPPVTVEPMPVVGYEPEAPPIAPAPKPSVPTPTPVPAPAPTTPTVSFTDVPEGHYAKPAIEDLTLRGVVTGYPDGSFQPDREISRSEFAIMLTRALKYQDTDDYEYDFNDFTDLYANAWYSRELTIALHNGVTKGFTDATYRPDNIIPREQSAIMLANILRKYSLQPQNAVAFPDLSQAIAWSRADIEYAGQAGLLKGDPSGRIQPKKHLTRGEAAVMVYRLLQKIQ